MALLQPIKSILLLQFAVLLMLGPTLRAAVIVEPRTALHYASNGNFGADRTYSPRVAGFNLADVNNASQLASLPPGVKGLVWVGTCNGADTAFIETVRPYIGNPKLFGFYLMDDPDPRLRLVGWRMSATCTAENLRAESDWIHANIPGAKTFIILMNLSSSRRPSFDNTYNPANSHVDLCGIDPYPCRTELHGCDYDMINRYVNAALSWGVPRESIVPVYQTFGGGDWDDGDGGRYVLPTASEQRQILSRWGTLIATPVFDFAYSWGSQKRDVALEGAPDLKEVFSIHNGPATTAASNQAAPPREILVGQ
jgi:hypothetical protein